MRKWKASVLTTGDVSRICEVAPRTVAKWMDAGHIQGYRIPGSKDRRFTREAVLRFMRENDFPVPAWLAAGGGLLLATPSRELLERASAAMGLVPVQACGGLLEAGMAWSERRHGAVALDLALGRADCLAAAARLAACEDAPRLAAVLTDDADPAECLAAGFSAAVAPGDCRALAGFFLAEVRRW